MKATLILEVYRDRQGAWRWQARAPNGQLLAWSARSYRRRWDAERGWRRFHGDETYWRQVITRREDST